MFIGHKREDGKTQPLEAHLSGVAALASGFGEAFGAQAHARRTAILHDAGKYSRAGQRRMADPEHTPKVDHSTAGARIAWENCNDRIAALAIAGHHGGMPDLGGRMSAEGDGTLVARLRKDLSGDLDYAAFWQENAIEQGMAVPQWLMGKVNPFAVQFYARMLFSCLVDADFLDTERFMQGETPRGGCESIEKLQARLLAHVQPWLDDPKGAINRKRSEILRDCLRAGEGARGLYTLTVPTGGGKTVSSLAFALAHAARHGLDRVIYVIPYTSIIEQNANVFRSILGEDNVIEHHSGVAYDAREDMEDPSAMRRMLAAENWDAPVIVTTAVQFFESLFSNKPSKCRKLHNIVNSVIIFDEAQMLPVPYLRPCVAAIAELVRHYRATAVLCTATQPALNRYFAAYDAAIDIHEICGDVDALQAFFRRVRFVQRGATDTAALAQALSRQRQVLCVVNTRKSAQEIFARMPEQGSYHLSTRMTPAHRTRVLEEIRGRLRDGEDCRVVSTSLIEAGVDVDFPQVWREMAGLDSLLQAAGRCNREGCRQPDESEVVIFTLEGGVPKGMQPNAVAAEVAMEGAAHLDDRAVVRRYFEQLYWQRGDAALDVKNIMEMGLTLKLKTMADTFRLIESDARTIYIPTDDNAEDLALLRGGVFSRGLMRRLGRSAVNVEPWDWKRLLDAGAIEQIGDGMAILVDQTVYDPLCGLKTDTDSGKGLWI